MSMETERLAREAEQHRTHLDSTIDQLKSRLSVGQIVDEMWSYVREGQGAEMTQNLGRQVRQNPLALGLIGAGVAWLFLGQGSRSDRANWRGEGAYDDAYFDPYRAEGASSDDAYMSNGGSRVNGSSRSSTMHSLADTTKSAVSGAMEGAQKTFGTVSDATTNVAGSVRHSARSLLHKTSSTGYRANEMAQSTWRNLMRSLQDEPLVVGAVAVAIGAAIGASLPPTRQEDKLLGGARDQLKDSLTSYGKDAADKAQRVASEAYQAGREKVYNPDDKDASLADTVISAGEAATEAAKNAAQKEGLI